MTTTRPQRGVAARTENKIKRRENILAQARQLIVHQGFNAFTLAELATKANVTVPTIHNLIGNKSDVFRQLVEAMVTRTEQVLTQAPFVDPITTTETFIDNLLGLYAEDEALYKAAFVIGEQEQLFEQQLSTGIFRQSLAIAQRVCIDAQANGYLQGNITSSLLADKLFANQRLARHDWVQGYIDLAAYRQQVLLGMFITFAADATPAFHHVLVNKIHALTAPEKPKKDK